MDPLIAVFRWFNCDALLNAMHFEPLISFNSKQQRIYSEFYTDEYFEKIFCDLAQQTGRSPKLVVILWGTDKTINGMSFYLVIHLF